MAYARKLGRNRYQGLYKRNGRQNSVGIFPRERDALDAAKAAELGPAGDKRKMLLADYAVDYMDGLNFREGTLLLYEWAIENHILPGFKNMLLREIEPLDVRRWAVNLQRRGLSPRSQRIVFDTLGRILEQAIEDGYADINPCTKSVRTKSLQKQSKKKNNYVTPEQLLRIADAVKPRFKAAVLVMGMCGLRFGEMAGLRYEDVHLDELHPRLSIVGALKEHHGQCYYEGLTKTDNPRDVIVPKPLVKVLRHHIATYADHEVQVFSGETGAYMRRHWNRRHFKPACVKLGLSEELSPHDLRHTCVAILLDANVPLHDVADWVGHEGIRTTMQYGGGYESQERTAKVLDAVFAEARKMKPPTVEVITRSSPK